MSFSLPSSPKIKSVFTSSSNSKSTQHAQQPSPPIALLPSTHPLIAELTSLRQQLAAYQKAAHQASIQLQGVRLELALSKEKEERWGREKEGLEREVEVLRLNPLPPTPLPTSNALTELSLAHRRLSSKLDLTETELSSTKLELSKLQLELQRVNKERDGDRAIINELRRTEEDREEELEWEKGERKKAEEMKKLCDLALDEYRTLVHSLDPTAVPPSTPSKTTSSIFHTPSLQRLSLDGESQMPTSTDDLQTPPLTTTSTTLTSPIPVSPGEVISNLLIGQKGVQQLFQDFTEFLISKDKHIHFLEQKVEELEHSSKVAIEQLESESKLRVEAENERDKALRDDESASKVVERYMTFTQKTHQTLHIHLNNLRSRSNATSSTLRNQLNNVKSELVLEREKSTKLHEKFDDLLQSFLRESTGRRREISLRLKLISNQEKMESEFEKWLNKVEKIRNDIEGVVVEPDILEGLLDEVIDIISSAAEKEKGRRGNDKSRSWRGLGGILDKKNRLKKENGVERNYQEESLARILLAEELVTTLVADLQDETEKRMELERQRVEWLAKDAIGGVKVEDEEEEGEDGHVVFDLDDAEHGHAGGEKGPGSAQDEGPHHSDQTGDKTFVSEEEENDNNQITTTLQPISAEIAPPTPISPIIEPSPLITQLKEMFEPITARYSPLQKTLHDLSHSLSGLRSSLPTLDQTPPTNSTSPKSNRKSHFLHLSKLPPLPIHTSSGSHDPIMLSILEGLHEVIEDARVDVEIALADHERVYRGFEALLNVGKGKNTQSMMHEIREYTASKEKGNDEGYRRLEGRIAGIESDLTEIKKVIHSSQIEGLSGTTDQDGEKKSKSIWDKIELKTITIPSNPTKSFFGVSPISSPLPSSPLFEGLPHSPLDGPIAMGRRTSNMFSTVGNVSRSFGSSVIGAPRRVSDLATGLYRPDTAGHRKQDQDQEEQAGLVARVDEDDVE
ncbi:hypothetical protein I302_102996 [Kwoniella bestiolae CBS 10118]|uniref:Uncharacterized protein n=1 Tax=Kwoniella bestiolae CBS 10118 TaxID=1296100 RepID=A0A1B9GGJ3_9TREE|nr:hypothetical protein I302_01692 [Kwoniella bestiolae CBS 10118]OCF30173.1 hypothetical protein I302_01692 [Kwoniella bestiolae CBS 10118]